MSSALRAIGSLSRQRAYWGNTTLLVLDGLALVAANDLGGRGPWLAALGVVCASGLAAWAGNTWRQRWIENVPTSRIASAAQGYVELAGHIDSHPNERLRAKLSQTPCAWYRYQIEKKDADGNWRVEEFGSSDQTFLLNDGTGSCVVDPEGAEITTSHKRTWTQGERRYTELLLLPGDPLYALGEFRTLGEEAASGAVRQEISRLLAEWKADRPALLRRFDRNRDGEVDLAEWEQARAAATAEVAAVQRERTQTLLNLLARPTGQRPYLLSNLGDDGLRQRYRRWAWAHLGIFFAACVGLAYWAQP